MSFHASKPKWMRVNAAVLAAMAVWASTLHAGAVPYYTATPLGTLGGTNSGGRAINSSGQVAGVASTSGNAAYHAFFYSGGTSFDLNSLVVSGLGAATLADARGINEYDQIVANACNGPGEAESCTAYRLDPLAAPAGPTDIPTLSQWALAATTLLLLAGGWLGLHGASKGSPPGTLLALRRKPRK